LPGETAEAERESAATTGAEGSPCANPRPPFEVAAGSTVIRGSGSALSIFFLLDRVIGLNSSVEAVLWTGGAEKRLEFDVTDGIGLWLSVNPKLVFEVAADGAINCGSESLISIFFLLDTSLLLGASVKAVLWTGEIAEAGRKFAAIP
jgi:hypothetical protein